MISCKNLYNNSWVDISDYLGEFSIPFISRNRDYTMRAETMTFNIFGSLKDIRGANFKFDTNDRIAFYDGTKVLFAGYITKATYKYADEQWNVELISDLGKSDNHLVDYDTLHSVFSNGANSVDQYRPMSYFNSPTVGVFFAMRCMFSVMGFTLDTSDIDNVTAFTWVEEGINILYKNLFLSENELYNLGQSKYMYHTVVDSQYKDYKKNKKKFFDLINEILTSLSLHVQIVDIDNYKLMSKTTNYIVADNDKYDYSTDPVAAGSDINTLGVSVVPASAQYCLANIGYEIDNLDGISIGDGGGIDLLEKFRIYYEREIVSLDLNKCIKITNAVFDGGVVYIDTETAHGLTSGTKVMLMAIAGFPYLSTQAIEYSVNNRSEKQITVSSEDKDEFFVSGGSGWIYKGDFPNYWNSYHFRGLEILAQTTDSDSINVIKNRVIAETSDYTKETITGPITTEEKTVVQNFIIVDDENECSEIVQEIY